MYELTRDDNASSEPQGDGNELQDLLLWPRSRFSRSMVPFLVSERGVRSEELDLLSRTGIRVVCHLVAPSTLSSSRLFSRKSDWPEMSSAGRQKGFQMACR
jgi:hypothetical protein